MKKLAWWTGIVAAILIVAAFLIGKNVGGSLVGLPMPELAEGQRGELGIDKNINEGTIDKYLNRSDAVYRDMRMLKDPGNYEAIGGDSYLSGFVRGFEVVPLPYLVNVKGLPEEVGETYTGETLYRLHSDGSYTANYEESEAILAALISLGCDRLLTAGHATNVNDGEQTLKILNGKAAGRIIIMAGSGVRPGNISRLESTAGLSEFHSSSHGPDGRTDRRTVREMVSTIKY